MKRIAIAGFQHETNTFSPHAATLKHFQEADNWPGLLEGDAVISSMHEINIPISGFIAEAQRQNWELLPLVWANAIPSGIVEREAFETILKMICDALHEQMPVDAVYLDLHGAMVSEVTRDGEAEILRAIRKIVGANVPVVASLDLHANVSPEMMALSDILVAYRTYPHVDMAETGQRTALQLQKIFQQQKKPFKLFYKFPFLIPIVSQSTLSFPANEIAAEIERLSKKYDSCISFAPGFPLADMYESGPAVFLYGWDNTLMNQLLLECCQLVESYKNDFSVSLFSAEEAVKHVKEEKSGTSILVDTQDNPGCGGSSDTVGLLRAMLDGHLENAAIAMICDPEVALAAFKAGKGSEIHVALGAKSNDVEQPIEGTFEVVNVSDKPFLGTGAYYKNARIDVAPTAWLKLGGVDILVGSRRVQAADQSLFRHLGLDPSAKSVLGLKSSVHYRADFDEIAARHIVVESPGENVANLKRLSYQFLRPDVEIL